MLEYRATVDGVCTYGGGGLTPSQTNRNEVMIKKEGNEGRENVREQQMLSMAVSSFVTSYKSAKTFQETEK